VPYSHHAEGDKNIIQQKPKATRWKNTLAVIKKANQQRYLGDIIFISRDPMAVGDSGSLITFRHPFTGEINSFKISS